MVQYDSLNPVLNHTVRRGEGTYTFGGSHLDHYGVGVDRLIGFRAVDLRKTFAGFTVRMNLKMWAQSEVPDPFLGHNLVCSEFGVIIEVFCLKGKTIHITPSYITSTGVGACNM